MNRKLFGIMGLLFVEIFLTETTWSDMKYLGCMRDIIYDIEIGPDHLLYLSMPGWLYVRSNDGTYSTIVGSQDNFLVDQNLDDINGKRAQDIAIDIIDFDFDEEKIFFLRKKRRPDFSIYYKAELGYIDSEGLIHTVDIDLPFKIDNNENDAHILIKNKSIFLSGNVPDTNPDNNKYSIFVLENTNLRKYIDIELWYPYFDMDGDTIVARVDHKTFVRINREGALNYFNIKENLWERVYYSDSFMTLNGDDLIVLRLIENRLQNLYSNEIIFVKDSTVKISSVPKSFYHSKAQLGAITDSKFAYDEDNDILFVCLNNPQKTIQQYPVEIGTLWKIENIEDLIKSAIPDWSVR